MIGQYLPQINESATVTKSKIFSHLNKAIELNELVVIELTVQHTTTSVLLCPPVRLVRDRVLAQSLAGRPSSSSSSSIFRSLMMNIHARN